MILPGLIHGHKVRVVDRFYGLGGVAPAGHNHRGNRFHNRHQYSGCEIGCETERQEMRSKRD